MPVPALLLIGPLLGSVIVHLIRRWVAASIIVGTLVTWIVALGLLILKFTFNVNQFLGDSWTIFEQSVSIREQHLLILSFVFLLTGFVFLLSWITPQNELFIPVSLLVLSPLSATLMVEPFQNGAVMLLVVGGLMTILVQGQQPGSTLSSVRYLTLTIIGVPLLVAAGWLIDTRQVQYLPLVAYFLLFAIMILIFSFPFHIWVGPIVARVSSLVPVVIFGLIQTIIVIFAIQILVENPVIYGNARFLGIFRISGVITLLLAMILALSAQTIGRLLGYLIVMDIGSTILSLALGGRDGLELIVVLLILRITGLLAIGVGFGLLHQELGSTNNKVLSFDIVQGQAYRTPFRVALLVFGALSLAGAPFTPGFVGRWHLVQASEGQSITVTIIVIASVVVGILSVAKLLVRMLTYESVKPEIQAPGWQLGKFVIIFLILLGLLVSLFPEQLIAMTNQLTRLV